MIASVRRSFVLVYESVAGDTADIDVIFKGLPTFRNAS